jgi:hypothetical protein
MRMVGVQTMLTLCSFSRAAPCLPSVHVRRVGPKHGLSPPPRSSPAPACSHRLYSQRSSPFRGTCSRSWRVRPHRAWSSFSYHLRSPFSLHNSSTLSTNLVFNHRRARDKMFRQVKRTRAMTTARGRLRPHPDNPSACVWTSLRSKGSVNKNTCSSLERPGI